MALANNNTVLSGSCPSSIAIVDFIGFGSANCFEGVAASPAGSNTLAPTRNSAGCTDNNVNSTDFSAVTLISYASAANFCNLPTIASFTPSSGSVGTSVTITGTKFNTTPANDVVYFGAVQAPVTSASTTSLTVTAPAGATYHPISVLNNAQGLTGYSSKPFITTFTNPLGTGITSGFYKLKAFNTGNKPAGITISDFDGDGKPDMAVVNYSDNTVSVRRNISVAGAIASSSFAANVNFSTGSTPVSVTAGDIRWRWQT